LFKETHHNDDNGTFMTCVTLLELLLRFRVSSVIFMFISFVFAFRFSLATVGNLFYLEDKFCCKFYSLMIWII